MAPNFLWRTGNALLEDDKVFHLVRPVDELDEIKSKRGSIKDKSMTKAITEIYLTRLLSVKVTVAPPACAAPRYLESGLFRSMSKSLLFQRLFF